MNRASSVPLPARAGLVVGLAGVVLLLLAGPAHAYMAARVALDSNIVVYDGRVVFAQGTGTLTVLELPRWRFSARRTGSSGFISRSVGLPHPCWPES